MLGNTFSKNVIYQNHNHKNRMAIVRHWYLLLLLSAAASLWFRRISGHFRPESKRRFIP